MWSKNIDFDFGGGLHARGVLGNSESGKYSEGGSWLSSAGGVSLRVAVMKRTGLGRYSAHRTSYEYQRLFGELTLEGFDISHTKDGFRWGEDEEPFVELLREYADDEPLPLIRQARGYRAGTSRPPKSSLSDEAQSVATETVAVLGRELSRSAVDQFIPADTTLPDDLSHSTDLFPATIELRYRSQIWRVTVEISDDPSHVWDWFEVAEHVESNQDDDPLNVIRLRMSLRHPFSERYVGANYENMDLLTRVAAGLAVAEITARDAGARQAGEIRRRFNELLCTVLSKP